MPPKSSAESLKLFKLWLGLGICLILLVIYLSLTSKPPIVVSFALNDKIGHFLAYAVLMGWFGQIFQGRLSLALFALGFSGMGIALEYLQGMGHHRHFEYADMGANIIGVVIGLILTVFFFKDVFAWIEVKLGVSDVGSDSQ